MVRSLTKRISVLLAFALAVALASSTVGWAEEGALPPEGDSVVSPFSPDGYVEMDGSEADAISPYSLKASDYDLIMDCALQYEGWDYIWGGRYPSQGGFDCTGLVMHVYNTVFDCGFDVMNTNAERLYNNHCTYVSEERAKPGDLVFWRGTYGNLRSITHVGIYCGDGITYGAGDPIGYYKIRSVKNVQGRVAEYFFASIKGLDGRLIAPPENMPENASAMYRFYNPNSGEHFYTKDTNEGTSLIRAGWDYEGVGWVAPNTGDDVYRLYNPNAGDHHYTLSASERDKLVKAGWSYEGVGWKSGGEAPLYRQYNPNAVAGAHNFTLSNGEHNALVKIGWHDEGIAWYALQ